MVIARRSLGGALVGVMLAANPVASQDAQPAGAQGGQAAPAAPAVGYQGVVPGTGQPPAVLDKPGGEEVSITWPGFQMLPNGGSRFFVQATGALSADTQTEASKITINLGRAKLATGTNGLMLETRFFNTPVKRAHVRRKGGNAILVLEMRVPAQPLVRSQQSGTGFHFVYIDFAPGQFLATPEAVSETPQQEAPKAAPATGGTIVMPTAVAAPAHLDDTARDDAKAKGSVSGSASASSGKGKAKAKASGSAKIGF